MVKVLELKQNRNLIKSDFDGFVLSLDPVPILRENHTSPPHKALPNADQYSLLHAEMFSMQNLLYGDPWNRSISYFVNRKGEVICCAYNENTGSREPLKVIFELSNESVQQRISGDYNYTLKFVSEKYCVLCDGIYNLLLLDTGDRIKGVPWKVVTKMNISSHEHLANIRGFIIYDCRLDIINEKKRISLALGRVHRADASNNSTNHYMHIHIGRWSLTSDIWEFSLLDALESKGSLYYCSFEPRAESIVVCSNHKFIFCSNKHEEPSPQESNSVVCEKSQLHDKCVEMNNITWSQADDEIVIKINLQHIKAKTDYDIKSESNALNVKCGDETLLDCKLLYQVDKDLTTWTLENNYIQITLMKEIVERNWASLFSDGTGPKESTDDKPFTLPVDQQPIPNLDAPIEDCDLPIGTMDDNITIDRFHLGTKTITHTVHLGSSPPLFSTSLRPGYPLAIVTRQGVDASLWLQHYNPSKPDEWYLRHEGNLHSFAYIQASKRDKKFIDCSIDLNYSLICEPYRYLYLYKSQHEGSNGLRNRHGPQVALGKQHLISLEETGEVLGISTANQVITLLTENSLLFIQITGN